MKSSLPIVALLALAVASPAAALSIPESIAQAAAPAPIDAERAARIRICATPSPTPAERTAVRARLAADAQRFGARLNVGGEIPVAVHVITDGALGQVSDDAIAEQIRALNRGYAGSGIRFSLASVDRTDRHAWFRMNPGAEKQAKQALAIDPAHRLNLYTCAPGQGILGWAYYPWSAPEDSWWHGVVVHYGTLPGGYLEHYNEGGSAVHEVGHYLGLFHTFEGGCTPPGDEVDDTPYEGSPAFGCPVGRNTCPQPGDDPIHNYMDYTDDPCYTEFTAGQVARIDAIVPVYRPSLLGTGLVADGATAGAQAVDLTEERPAKIELRGAFPNPAPGEAVLRFALPSSDHVALRVYNVAGQRVATLIDARLPAGEHSALFRGHDLPTGMYFVELRVGNVRQTRSVVLTH